MNELKIDERPKGLNRLLILTLVNGVYTVMMSILSLFTEPSSANLKKAELEAAVEIAKLRELNMVYPADLLQKIQDMTSALNSHYVGVTLVSLCLGVLAIASVILMRQRNEKGFHLYIVYNLLQVGSLYLFISPALIPMEILGINLLISLVFVLLYSKHRHYFTTEQD